MPNRDTHPYTYPDTGESPKERYARYKRNGFHIDGGEIFETLKAYVENRPPKEYKAPSPSSLGGCPRVLWFKLKGYEETTSPGLGTLTTFALGRQYERMMVEAHYEKGNLVHWFPDREAEQVVPGIPTELTGYADPFEYTFPDGTPLVGTPDFLTMYNGKLTVTDAKSARDDSFQYVDPTNEALISEKKDYFWQTVAYIVLLNKSLDRLQEICGARFKELGIDGKVEQGLFYIYDKQGGIVKRECLVQPTKDQFLAMAAKAKLVWDHFQAGTLPPCTCADDAWHLEYCNFGNPGNRVTNRKGKEVNHECCELEIIEQLQPKVEKAAA